jgi:hypothetical protein
MASRKAKRMMIAGALVALAAVSAALLAARLRPEASAGRRPVSTYSSDDRMGDLPRLMLWAWERPEDLRFVNPREVGVAFLAETITLSGDRTITRPRLQPLALAPETMRVAVARVEADARRRPRLSDEQRDRVVAELTKLARGENVAAIQIDFDALRSERPFYRALLGDLRSRLPATTRLSITALASWCLGDDWIADLPIDEAVPMLFRMGADRENITLRLEAGDDFSVPVARHSVGISTDEPLGARFADRRVYVFNPRPWSPSSVEQITREVQQKR